MAADRHERIRQRAYELWEHEGQPEGRALDHWRQAEAETAAAQPGAGGDEHQGDPGAAPPAPALGSSDGTRAVPPGTEAGRDAASAAVKSRARGDRKRGRAPSDLAADEAAKGGGGVGPVAGIPRPVPASGGVLVAHLRPAVRSASAAGRRRGPT